jgi:hypothetical protein
MIAWINLAVLVFATLFFLYFYFLSVSPAALENVAGSLTPSPAVGSNTS